MKSNTIKAFQPGNVIEFCGDRYEVLANYGRCGRVRCLDDGDSVCEPFYWKLGEDESVLVEGKSHENR